MDRVQGFLTDAQNVERIEVETAQFQVSNALFQIVSISFLTAKAHRRVKFLFCTEVARLDIGFDVRDIAFQRAKWHMDMLVIDVAVMAIAEWANRSLNWLIVKASFCQWSRTIKIGQEPAETEEITSQFEIESIFKILEGRKVASLKEGRHQIFS